MSDASVRLIDGRAVVEVGGSELLSPIVAQAKGFRDQAGTLVDQGEAAANLATGKSVEASQYAAAASALANRFPTYAAGNAAVANGIDFTVVDGAGGWINVYRKGTSTGAGDPLIQLPGKAAYGGANGAALIGTGDGRSLQAVLSDVKVIPLQRFVPDASVADATAAVQAWANAVMASAPAIGAMNGLQVRANEIDLSGARNIVIDGGGRGGLLPVAGIQTSGRFVGTNLGKISFRNGSSVQTAGYHYKPTIDLYGDQSGPCRIDNWSFEGCGYGARLTTFLGGGADYCTGRQVGIFPRPAPLDPAGTESAYGASFEIYGGGIRATFTPGFVFGDHNDFRNNQPGGGHTSDRGGGAGFFTMHACDGGKFGASYSLNSPGQGFLGSGEWQGMDVVSQVLAGTFDPTLRGKDYIFDGCRAEGSNQENVTAFGALRPKILNVRSRNSRFTSVEVWQCVDPVISGGEMYEEASASHPITSGIGGEGAIHVVECYNFKVISPKIGKSRANGIRIDGSVKGEVSNPTIQNYGADLGSVEKASGIACNAGLQYSSEPRRLSTQISVHGGDFTPAAGNTIGADLFAASSDQVLYQWANRNSARPLKFGGVNSAFRGQPQFHSSAPLLMGPSVQQPASKLYAADRALHIGTSAGPIFQMVPITAGQRDAYMIIVAGALDTDPGTAFTDIVIVINGGAAQKLGGDQVGEQPPPGGPGC